MARVLFNGTVIAESDDIEQVEGNPYFPLESLDRSVVTETDLHTFCPWKGEASYFTIEVAGGRVDNAAWFYPDPMEGAEAVESRVAFYADKVTIET